MHGNSWPTYGQLSAIEDQNGHTLIKFAQKIITHIFYILMPKSKKFIQFLMP